MVLVQIRAANVTGTGWTYGSPACAAIVAGKLAGIVCGRDPMDTAGSEAGNSYLERMRHDLNVIASAAGLPLDVNAPAPVGGAK